MSKLTGKALQDRARDLNIPGRSKMSADELRDAVIAADTANLPEEIPSDVMFGALENSANGNVTDLGDFTQYVDEATEEETEAPEPTFIVPNRKESRKRRRNLGRLRNDGTPHGGHETGPPREESFDASVIAGQRGKFYGNRKSAHRTTAAFPGEPDNPGPRKVPVKVVHEGH